MALNNFSSSVRNAIANAVADACDVGSANAQGRLRIYTAGFSTLLAELNMANPAFGDAAAGVATANAITDDSSADATGTAAVFRIVNRDAATVVEGTVSTSGADLNLNSTSITAGVAVSVSSLTVTAPA